MPTGVYISFGAGRATNQRIVVSPSQCADDVASLHFCFGIHLIWGSLSHQMSTEGGAAAAGAAPGGDPPTGENGEIVGGPRGPQQIAAQKRMQQTQAQVDEVVDIMRTNVEKVLERDQKLSELDDRADALQQGASQFEQQAGKLKRKMWWKNLKMMIIMGVIGLIVLIIIVVWAVSENQ
ncbi:hypothetical protein Pcinc_023691 [Petrolisthes cinctipes]|uniref:V-SNARE coiled-coil homology domain-containing protein n=3 Tax=Petrolisthes TaxID=84661 RepID=A0AAE1FES2_PETCI|nr:hypothetical protein Pcinc_023691 [Petrolisthes cinctipes]